MVFLPSHFVGMVEGLLGFAKGNGIDDDVVILRVASATVGIFVLVIPRRRRFCGSPSRTHRFQPWGIFGNPNPSLRFDRRRSNRRCHQGIMYCGHDERVWNVISRELFVANLERSCSVHGSTEDDRASFFLSLFFSAHGPATAVFEFRGKNWCVCMSFRLLAAAMRCWFPGNPQVVGDDTARTLPNHGTFRNRNGICVVP